MRMGAEPPAEPRTDVRFSPALVRRLERWSRPFYRSYFRYEARRTDRIPRRPPTILVANHGGMGLVDVPLLGHVWYRRFGTARPLLGLSHQAVLRVPLLGPLMRRCGAVPAGPERARRLLSQGRDLLVYPGGDWEASRPFSQRDRIDFAGRTGFVRLALRARVPLVPVVICGAHESVVILVRGSRLAHLLRLDLAMRLKTLPITPQGLVFVYKLVQALRGRARRALLPLWLLNAWLSLPWLPVKVTMEFLEPIDLDAELAGIEDEEQRIRAGYHLVTGRMQVCLDRLRAERRARRRTTIRRRRPAPSPEVRDHPLQPVLFPPGE